MFAVLIQVPKPALRSKGAARSVQLSSVPRLFPNLNPRAVLDVNRDEIATLSTFFDQYRMTRPDMRGQGLPNSRYIFVTETSGAIRMHLRYRHPVLAQGKPVLYAGEACFQHGKLQWWSNGSGNYRPDRRYAAQAGLPIEQFLTYEQVRAGLRAPAGTKAET